MDDVFIRIHGLVSRSSMKRLYSKLSTDEPKANELLVFLDYSYFEIPLGFNFLYLLEVSNTKRSFPFSKGEIKLVTQNWGLPYPYGIPSGHKSVCNIEFDPVSIELLRSKIPVVDTWTSLNETYLLSNVDNDNWKNYYTPSA